MGREVRLVQGGEPGRRAAVRAIVLFAGGFAAFFACAAYGAAPEPAKAPAKSVKARKAS